MKKPYLLFLSLTTAIIASNAQAVELDRRPITTSLSVETQQHTLRAEIQPQKKAIVLMNIKLSPEEKQNILSYTPKQSPMLMKASSDTPSKIDLGMDGVPVLDQGQHGTCTTFANTAAVNAQLGKGDYISQLCNLELGKYLEDRSYQTSGWDGAFGAQILNQMLQFGIINKTIQRTKACGGILEYPAHNEANIGNPVTLDEFKPKSENISDKIYWEPILTANQRVEWESSKAELKANELLKQIKQTLASRSGARVTRMTFGALLPFKYCSVGACGNYHAKNDTWVLTDAILKDPSLEFGGHEMVIYGYDDNAIAIDNAGKKHQGLLLLRNSWGSAAGDNGNYYMSYDFFKKFALEVQGIKKVLHM